MGVPAHALGGGPPLAGHPQARLGQRGAAPQHSSVTSNACAPQLACMPGTCTLQMMLARFALCMAASQHQMLCSMLACALPTKCSLLFGCKGAHRACDVQDPIFKGNKVPNPETGYPGERQRPLDISQAHRCSNLIYR